MNLGDRRLLPFRLGLATEFRGLTERRGCLVSGSHGWGEFAPFADYGVNADARWLASAIEQADGLWPQPVRRRVEVNAIVPAVEPAVAAGMALASGCTTIKIKVGDPRGRDRVAAVRDAMPDAALRVDVNGAWSLEQAVEELEVLSLLGLEYAEQPVRSFEDMVALRARTDVALAADELIRIDRRFDDVALAADVAVLKVAPLGGVRKALQVAQRVGLPVVISSALDTSVGLAAAVAAACCLPEPPLACGLGTGSLFARDTTDPLLPVAGEVGWVDYPAPDFVETGEDLDYWKRRIQAAAEVLARS